MAINTDVKMSFGVPSMDGQFEVPDCAWIHYSMHTADDGNEVMGGFRLVYSEKQLTHNQMKSLISQIHKEFFPDGSDGEEEE